MSQQYSFAQAATALSVAPPAKDAELLDQPPTDSISSISFSPQAEYMAVSSWDNTVRAYEVGPGGQIQSRAAYQHQGPVLDICWNTEGNKIFSGGADNAGRMFDLATGQTTQVAQHDAPIKVVKWIETPQAHLLVTGSWDKTIKYWDLRTPNPVATIQLPERCYTFDVQYPLMVVGTADRHVEIYNLSNPTTVYKSTYSPLKWQTRTISCFKDKGNGTGASYTIGSIEGRVAVQYVEEKDTSRNYSFRCHRRDNVPNSKDNALIHAINAMALHPIHQSLATCGSDGTIHFWDTDSRTRLKSFDFTNLGPISSCAFNRNGDIFAYAISYDWSKGHSGLNPGQQNKVFLHLVEEQEVKKRPQRATEPVASRGFR